jgi:hypothetical protein
MLSRSMPLRSSPLSHSMEGTRGYDRPTDLSADLQGTCVDLVRSHKANGSIKTRRRRAGWNTDFLLQLLQIIR